ncbi:hypothetical protein BDV95DRAFT_604229 [Massariosphaeria phaeospora]|uniref:Uncharacterized protein n=1 Tax=Massariosphaeria phaeospora TaxID=100035 RepID=A0A7C8MBH0_9PLEO|nr:hypothetical protein BDV95DRAFT_604229 [Massariosphaeria phaeospora]
MARTKAMGKRRREVDIRATVTYPQTIPDSKSDPCLNPSATNEHTLKCGHRVVTAKENEVCAPNCHHVATSKHPIDTKGAADFHCQACIEMESEEKFKKEKKKLIAQKTDEEEWRQELREEYAKKIKKPVRKTYIAENITSVPCDEDGEPVKGYKPGKPGHPFDVGIPRSGAIMFEDIDPNPVPDPEPSIRPSKRKREALDKEPVEQAGSSRRLSKRKRKAPEQEPEQEDVMFVRSVNL